MDIAVITPTVISIATLDKIGFIGVYEFPEFTRMLARNEFADTLASIGQYSQRSGWSEWSEWSEWPEWFGLAG